MKIEIINTNVIKVMLSPEDLMDFGTSADKLDQDDENAGKVISDILTAVKIREGIDFSCRKLYIEAFDVCDGSCILYISAICGKKSAPLKEEHRILCSTKDFTSLGNAAKSLLKSANCTDILSDLLFEPPDRYCLILCVQNIPESFLYMLPEFFDSIYTDETECVKAMERMRPLITGNAVKTLSEL